VVDQKLPPVHSPLEVQKKQNSDKATVSKEQEEKSDGGGAQDNERYIHLQAAQACAAAPLVLQCRDLLLHLPPGSSIMLCTSKWSLQLSGSSSFYVQLHSQQGAKQRLIFPLQLALLCSSAGMNSYRL
jgi:hypothetical protein